MLLFWHLMVEQTPEKAGIVERKKCGTSRETLALVTQHHSLARLHPRTTSPS